MDLWRLKVATGRACLLCRLVDFVFVVLTVVYTYICNLPFTLVCELEWCWCVVKGEDCTCTHSYKVEELEMQLCALVSSFDAV